MRGDDSHAGQTPPADRLGIFELCLVADGQTVEVDVAALLHEIVDPYRAGLDGRIRMNLTIPALPSVFVDRNLISRSITNIVENALHAMPGSGTLGVSASAEDGSVHISVSDTGVGMDEEALARAFEPYFRPRRVGRGWGCRSQSEMWSERRHHYGAQRARSRCDGGDFPTGAPPLAPRSLPSEVAGDEAGAMPDR